MEKKMTSGEMASKAGISQKTLRLYDEKGLLKPVAHSEGNYRLYDEDSFIILEKIIALKHVGFSLEEIKDNLENSDNKSIPGILQNQVKMMETVIGDVEKLVERAASVLTPGGMFSMNYYGTTAEFGYWEEIFAELGMDTSFAVEKRHAREQQQEEVKTMLTKYFAKLEFVKIPGPLTYDDPERLYERALQRYPDGAKYLNAQKAKLIKYFEKKMAEDGAMVVQSCSGFWHCFK